MSCWFTPIVPVSAATVCTSSQASAIENRVHQLLNAERTGRGLKPLVRMESINTVARDWSVTMYESGDFAHRTDIGAQMPGSWSSVGENIIWWGGYNCDVEANAQRARDQWMASPGHRENILRSSYTHTGLGFHSGPDAKYSAITYGTQNFATYSSTSAPASVASISLSPTSGTAKSSVTVQGKGYPARYAVDILFGPSELKIGSATTDSSGNFSVRVTIPSVAEGSYAVRARAQNSGTYQQQTFLVQGGLATLSLSPTSAAPGEVVSFSGKNFQPGERVDIRWGSAYGKIIGYVTVRSDGTISGRVTVPATSTGTYTIVARGTLSGKAIGAKISVTTASSAKTVAPVINVTPTETSAGTVVRFSGQGFHPGELVNITWDAYNGQRLGYVRAGTDGAISGAVTVPSGATTGTHYLYARGQSSTITVRRALSIVAPQMRTMAMVSTGITLAQSNLNLGQTTTLTGQGFQPGEKVTVSTGWGAELMTVNAGEDGRFTAKISIPTSVPYADQPQGIRATGTVSQYQAEAPFTITNWDQASVSLSPATGPAGSTTTLEAAGYAPGEQVTVRVGSSQGPVLATAVADGSGTVRVDVTVPQDVQSGTVDLITVGSDGVLLGKGVFAIGEAAESTPEVTPTPAGTPDSETDPGSPDPQVTPTEESPEDVVAEPTAMPTDVPVETPTAAPTDVPTEEPTVAPTEVPTEVPTEEPTVAPTEVPTEAPVDDPADAPVEDGTDPVAFKPGTV